MVIAGGVKKRRNVRFTLIELLVVIAIIGILAGMLMPALNRARTAAHRVGGVSNARQIATALHMYADEFGTMPFVQECFWQVRAAGDRWRRLRNRFWSNRLGREGFLATPAIFWGPGRDWGQGEGWPHPGTWSWTVGGSAGGYFEQTGFGLAGGVTGGESAYRTRVQPDGPGTRTSARGWDGHGRGQPLRLGEGNSPPPSAMVMLADTFRTSCWVSNDTKFFYGHNSSQLSQGKDYHRHRNGLYNYDGGVVRAYVDGRAHAGGPNWTDESSLGSPDPDELGWDLESPYGVWVPSDDPRGGAPVYSSIWQYFRRAPWFYGWREGWAH